MLIKDEFRAEYRDRKMPILNFFFDPKGYINSGGTGVRLDNASILSSYGGARYLFPYLDAKVVDFAVSIPRHMYLKWGINRYIFREAFKDIMPKSLYKLNRKESPSDSVVEGYDPAQAFKTFRENRDEVLSNLDRDFLERYLDLKKIEKWVESEELPSDEEDELNRKALFTLIFLANSYCMLKKSREITVPDEIQNAI